MMERVTVTVAKRTAIFKYRHLVGFVIEICHWPGLICMHPVLVFNDFRAVLMAALLPWIIENAHDALIGAS